ncbi:MAG: type I glutamate--ammonia ligase [Fibrobacterales bacterium]
MKPADVIKLAQENDVKFVDLMFGDMFGSLQHFTLPIGDLNEDLFVEGAAFDGSSIRGWKSIDKSDMLMMPDPTSAFIDPFSKFSTVCLFCTILEPRTGAYYDRDPRSIAAKAVEYLTGQGIGDTAFFGPEPEFFIFDSVRFVSEPNSAFYAIESEESPWSTADEGSLGHTIPWKGGYSPVSPNDALADLRCEIALNMESMGITTEVHHHEVGTAGQCEVGTRFGTIIAAADQVHKLKYAVKNTAAAYGKSATFMPKPLFGDNGNGMHVHTSIRKGDVNIFAGDGYANMSQEALWAIGGILKHGRSIQAFTNPSVNSYRRLVPGYEAPVTLAYSATNRSASIRIPHVNADIARRFEFRCPDASGSPYLAFSAILMAMIDGIKNQIDPGEAMDKNIYDLPVEELAKMTATCASLEEALTELEGDMAWLVAGDVFTADMIEAYIEYKRENEILPMKLRPNPLEFELYYSC